MIESLFNKLRNWRWYDDPNMLVVWVHLLAGAYREGGTLMTSVARLSLETGLTEKQVRLCLDKLVRHGQITRNRADKRASITICEYDSYIGCCREIGQIKGQEKGEQRANEKKAPLLPPDGFSPCTPSSLTPYIPQETKKTADAVKETKHRFVKPTVEQIIFYCQERGYTVDAERFFDYYESKGWVVGKAPMKDWKAAVRNWAAKRESPATRPTAPAQQKTITKVKLSSGGFDF